MQEIVCLQCGHIGFRNAFIYCVKCLECAVHRYCLEIFPETFDEFVRWICEDCEAKDQKQHTLHNEGECTESNNVLHLVGPQMNNNAQRCESEEMATKKKYDTHLFQIKAKTKQLIDVNALLKANNERERAKVDALRTAGFSGLTHVTADPIHKQLVKFICEVYDEVSKSIKLSDDKVLPIQEKDIQRVYMVPAGPRKIRLEECRLEIHQLKEQLGIEGSKCDFVKLSVLKDRLIKCADPQNFARFCILYALVLLLCNLGNSAVSLKYAKYLVVFEEIANYNWARHILNHLLDDLSLVSRKKWKHPIGDMHFLMWGTSSKIELSFLL